MGRRPIGKRAIAAAILLAAACEARQPLAPTALGPSSPEPSAVELHDAPVAQEQANIRVLCFGDSFTYGTTHRAAPGLATLSPIEGYIPKLQRLLRGASDHTFSFVNSGLGGEDTSEGLARLPAELRIYNPDLVLLWLGIVDVNTNEKARFTVARNNLAAMMEMIDEEGAQVVIGTFPPMNPDGFRALKPEHVPRLNDIIRQEANAQQVPIAGHERAFGNDLTLIGTDGLHPNDNGYQVIAETWFDVIQELRLP